MHYKKIRITSYRPLADIEIELRPLNVLLGPNGAGKSSFLDVFDLLSRGARKDLARAISARGGIQQLITQGIPGGEQEPKLSIELSTQLEQTNDPLKYELHVGVRGTGYVIEKELLSPFQGSGYPQPFKWIDAWPGHIRFHDGTGLVAPTWEYDDNELALAQVPNVYKDAERFRARLAACQIYGHPDMGPSSPIRNPQTLDPVPLFPGAQGEDLIAVLYNLESRSDESYHRIMEGLRACFDDFEELKFPVVGRGRATFTWKDRKGRRFYPDQLSEGTLRLLWLMTMLLSPAKPSALFIDEPELSLHPEMLKILSGLLREASDSSQIFVATHSDRLIRWLQPEDLILLDKEEGVTKVRRGDDKELDVKKWLDEYTLDQVWLMGEMGARP